MSILCQNAITKFFFFNMGLTPSPFWTMFKSAQSVERDIPNWGPCCKIWKIYKWSQIVAPNTVFGVFCRICRFAIWISKILFLWNGLMSTLFASECNGVSEKSCDLALLVGCIILLIHIYAYSNQSCTAGTHIIIFTLRQCRLTRS